MPHSDRLLSRPFSLAFAGNLLHGMAFFLFIHLPSYLTDLGANATEIGVVIGVTAVSAIVSRPTLGKVMDTRGRLPVVLAGGALNALVPLLYLSVSSIGPWLYVVRVLHGFSISMVFTGLFTYGADIIPVSRRTEGLALFGVSGLMPIALGGVVGEIILAQADFNLLFIASAIFSGIGFLITIGLPETMVALAPGERRTGFFEAIWQRELIPIWVVSACFAFSLTGYFTFLRTYVDEAGIGSVGLFFACYAGTAIALRIGFAWLPERVGPTRVLYPAFGLLIAGFVVLARSGSSTDIAIAGVLCGAGHAYSFPILMGFTVSRATESGRGSAVAFFTALFDVGTLLGGPALGFLIEVSSYSTMYFTTGFFLAGAVGAFFLWERKLAVESVSSRPAT